MSFLEEVEVYNIKGKLTNDASRLGKLYKAKKNNYMSISVDHSLAEDYLKDKWEVDTILKTKTRLRKLKSHSKIFEDNVWCQMYDLGYRNLNYDETFVLPFGKNPEDRKQIDIVAIDNETIILIECKSSEQPKKAPSYKDEFDLLNLRLDGYRKVFDQAFGKGRKMKFIFATHNLRISSDSVDLARLLKTKSYYYNNNTFKYLNELIKKYKKSSRYQFLGLLFKNQIINDSKIEIPALEGIMGNKKYYMFSIEPELLLKMGFVLHRTRANEEEMPTYQRLLQPSRLKGISKFINDGGYFPNSIIVNFSESKFKLEFKASSKSVNSSSKFGTLQLPNAYAIAYIIDGQHRLYGYANSKYKKTNTVPVVAFCNLKPQEQLQLFMDINQNQKAVSASLRLTLEEDLFWSSDRADSRLKALRSSIIREMSEDQNNILYGKISIGEDTSVLAFKPFYNAIMHSGLLPTAKGNSYVDESTIAALYNVNNHNHEKEMISARKKVIKLLNLCYEFVELKYSELFSRDKSFIMSNRGTYGYITLVGSLNSFLTAKGLINIDSNPDERFTYMEKYLASLMDFLTNISKEEEEKQLAFLGSGADVKWLRFFQNAINIKHKEYDPVELVDWRERLNDDLQAEGRRYGVEIEKKIKKLVITKLETLYKKNWELEINSIKIGCYARAEAENEKNYKEGLDEKKFHWTEMFNITDYKKIIEDYWSKKPDNEEEASKYVTFEKDFSIDIGIGKNKKDMIKWISHFNSYRNLWAHEGTKDKRLNKKEVGFLEKVYNHFYSTKL
ncbi:DGQHR domain-containing protein [Flavobacteriaceae bacterium KMM 6898]|nr:DGQHR domain-containing protein [Flavobacteriaceae bacterium KMM 6898]